MHKGAAELLAEEAHERSRVSQGTAVLQPGARCSENVLGSAHLDEHLFRWGKEGGLGVGPMQEAGCALLLIYISLNMSLKEFFADEETSSAVTGLGASFMSSNPRYLYND